MVVPDQEYSRKSEHIFTGERFMPQQTDPLLALEHYHRYCCASRFAKGRRVLDIACGEGYGSAFLAKWAREVVGMDSDSTTIDQATHKYSSIHNLTFKVGRCETGIEDPKGFDLVVCYETIEHLAENDQKVFLNNVESILKQDGLFIVSSPEKDEYAEAAQSENQFHKHEMSLSELQSLLETRFRHVYLCGQRILSLSAIWQLKKWQEAQFHFNARRNLLEDVPYEDSFSLPLYLIALCSNSPLSNDVVAEANSFYFDTANVEKTKKFHEWAMQMDADAQKSRKAVRSLEEELDKRAIWAQSLKAEVEKERAHFVQLKGEWKERTRWAQSLEAEVEKERACSRQLNAKLIEITGKLTTVSSSTTYRLLRKIGLLPDVWGGK